jgi:outer membrane protein OmpA-like peptidoglycan-associated protein
MNRCPPGANRALVFAIVALLSAGCATRSGTVVLLPGKDGRDAAVDVRQGSETLVLDRPYAAADLTSSGPRPRTMSEEQVQATFGAALAAQPGRPTTFTLYFVERTDQLTEESTRVIESVFAQIAAYPVPDIVVVGHSDRVGSDAANDALSRQRAETVRTALVRRGIAPESVVAIGRGEREPLVPTADGVAEPRNRRVEIVVR